MRRLSSSALLGIEYPLRGVEIRTGQGVDRGPGGTPSGLRFVDAVTRRDNGNRPAIQHLINQQIHQHICPLDGHIRRTDLALDLGADMPHLPGGAGFLYYSHDMVSYSCDPAGVGDRGRLGAGVSALGTIAPRRRVRPARPPGIRAAAHKARHDGNLSLAEALDMTRFEVYGSYLDEEYIGNRAKRLVGRRV